MKKLMTLACAALLALGASASFYVLDNATANVTLDASTQYNSTDRFLIHQGACTLGAGASVICGGNDNNNCNFIGVDRNKPAYLTINGGTFWCSSANGAGVLGVGNNNNGQSSALTLNSGVLKVDTRLRMSTMWSGTSGATSSGTTTINGGTATIKEVLVGATSSSTGTATLNLNGGVLTTSALTFPAYNGQALNLSGGMLVAAADNIFHMTTYAGSKTRALTVTAGKTTVFDTNGHNQALPEALVGTGTLLLCGGGTVTFASSTPTYGVKLGGVTLGIDAGDGTGDLLALNLMLADDSAYPAQNTLDVSYSSAAPDRVPLFKITSSLGGAEALAHLKCNQGSLSYTDGIVYLDRTTPPTDALIYTGAGGDDTPAGTSYTYLAFLDPTGSYTVGGDGFTLTDAKAVIASRSASAQHVSAPITASATSQVAVDVATGSLDLAGGLTASSIVKRGEGTLALGAASSLNTVAMDAGTIDFGGATYASKTLALANAYGAGKKVTFTNGIWSEPANSIRIDYTGWEVHFGKDFNFTLQGANDRIAVGYNGSAPGQTQSLVLDEGCGTITLRGNGSNNGNFIGVDVTGDSSLVVKGGTLHAVRDGAGSPGSGVIRVAAGNNASVTGRVEVAGGTFIVDWDLTFGTQYNSWNGGNGQGSFTLTGGTASVAQFYLGGATASSSSTTVRLTGGDLSVKSFAALAYNRQSLYIDGITIHALCDDADRSVKFLEKKGSVIADTQTYEIGADGVDIDTAGFTVHGSIPFTGAGTMRVAGGGNLIYSTGFALDGGFAVTGATTLTVPCYETYPSLTLGPDAKLAIDLSNFDGNETVLTITNGLGLPEGKTAADLAEFVTVVNGTGDVSISDDLTTIHLAAAASIALRHLANAQKQTPGAWFDTYFPATAELLPKCDLAFLANGSSVGDTAWAAQYIAGSLNRADGWVNVSAEQAGTWTIVDGYDDYSAFALDGTWVVTNSTYTVTATNTVAVSAGWHQFTILFGDGGGGYGPVSASAFPNDYPLGVAIGDGALVKFDAANFTFADPVAQTSGDFVLDRAGEVQFCSLRFRSDCRLVFDPAKTAVRLATAPVFTAAKQLALSSDYATTTKGRFLLMSWDTGTLKLPDGVTLTDLFDATSAAGANVAVTYEAVGDGGRLWLDLDTATAATPVTLFFLGDENAQDASRTLVARRLTAAGYAVKTTGVSSNVYEVTDALAPTDWTRFSGLANECLRTTTDHAGLDAAVEALVDQAGDGVDVVFLSIGANDLKLGTTAETLVPAWTSLVTRLIAQLPTAKIVCGTVTGLTDATAAAQAALFNAQIAALAADGTTFPANQVYVADRGTGTMDAADAATALTALAAPAVEATKPAVTTTTGSDVNVPAAYRAAFKRARVYDAIAVGVTNALTLNGEVPYLDFSTETGATDYVTRVGYYIALKRKNTDAVDYAGRVRWLWVDMESFGADLANVTLADVGVPSNTGARQQVVGKLHAIGNMPGVATIAPDDDTVRGFVEFWPTGYSPAAGSTAEGAPVHVYAFDWNDTATGGLYGSMQVHRIGGTAGLPGQTLFAFNRFMGTDGSAREIGLGNFANAVLGSLDWTFTSPLDTMNLSAYEVARIEIWTHSLRDEEDSQEPLTAYWRGTTNGDPSEASNWVCYNAAGKLIENAVPGIHTTIHVDAEGSMNLQAPATSTLAYYKFTVDGSLTLAADTDWSLFGDVAVPDGATIDLNGHKLYVRTLTATTAGQVTVTDTSALGGGELHFTLPENVTYTNNKIVFAGQMAFVLDGAGLFLPARANQTYTGGTVVTGGTLRMTMVGTNSPLGASGSTLRVESGATFDVYGYTGYTGINLVLAGGTLANTRTGVWQSAGLGNVTLAADSFVNKPYDVTLWYDGYTLDLGGHTLTVGGGAGQSFLMLCTATNGTLEVSDSWFATSAVAVDARTVDVRMLSGAKFYLRTDLSVHDYYTETAEANMSAIAGQTAAKLAVYGTFTPVVDTFRGCELQNGSAINLADKPDAWEMKSNLSAANVVTFADGAKVDLKLGDRKVGGSWQYVLTWGGNVPSNLSTLAFTVSGSRAQGACARADETGIKVARFGTVLYIR